MKYPMPGLYRILTACCIIACLVLAACGSSGTNSNNNSNTPTSSGSSGLTVPTAPPQEVPTNTPTPAQAQGQTFSNIRLLVNGVLYPNNESLQMKVGTTLDLVAQWDGGDISGTGWWVEIDGDSALKTCKTGSQCEGTDTRTSPSIPNREYIASLHDPNGNWVASNYVWITWGS